MVGFAPLDPARRGLFRRRRRDPEELLELLPGTVLVFQTNDRFALPPSGPRMLRSGIVVDAMAVLLVFTQRELVPVAVFLPSVDPKQMVFLHVSYHCRVTDPVLVLEEGCWTAQRTLGAHLLRDDTLKMLGAREDVATNPEVSQRILARVLATNELEPPNVPGLTAHLVSVSLGIGAAEVAGNGDGDGRIPDPELDTGDGFYDRPDGDRYPDSSVDGFDE